MRLQGLFMERAVNDFRSGKLAEVILFLKVAIGQKWFSRVSSRMPCHSCVHQLHRL